MATQEKSQETKQAAKQTGLDPVVLFSVASVLISWYYFFVQGEREKGLFVGLWPPTLIAFSSYLREVRIYDMLREHTERNLLTRVQRMLEEQSSM